MKLHLGCGQRYLKGYVNIDFPLSCHTVQLESKADICTDILSLKYPKETIEEIRLHHVFEHFQRPVACALVSSWYLWLKPNGILRIETPDFYSTAKVIFKRTVDDKQKNVAMRHLYGSHEANWAVHCEGYTPESLSRLLKNYGFDITKICKNSWKGTYNFEIFAQKSTASLNINSLKEITENYLKNFLVDETLELRLLSVWMRIYKNKIKRMV